MLAQNRVVQIGGDLNLAVCVEKRRQGMGVIDLERDTYQRGTDAAKVIQVIETKSVRGSGEKDQPFRTVIEYWSFDGKKIGEIDPFTSSAE